MITLDGARELAPYQDQPAQLPAASNGKVGVLRLGFERRGDRTILHDLYRQSPLLVQRALYWDEEMPQLPCVMILTTSGGVLQGDRLHMDVDLAPGSQAHLVTQAATKIQEMDANYGSQIQRFTLAEDTYLEYLPEPVIPYRGSRFVTDTRVRLPESATMLYGEVLQPGRKYYRDGELFAYDLFSSSLGAERPDGRQLFVEKFVVAPGQFPVARLGVMDRFHIFGNVVLLTSPERAARVYERTSTPVWDEETPLASAVSRLPNDAGLIFKVLGQETEPVRAAVRAFCVAAREEVTGRTFPPAFSWR
ncbi:MULTISPECIES: urease accessory protein UreD [Micromonospora]|jgi:urease accessory protein|uniref:urease accessory protein UreD n=1 Tax=Micromonospora TaxID=1873 RepID=UPI001B39912C|nr:MULTISPECIES: urease accessory protein UreD [Micromonospora]MBQ0981310.1 urease accessory protein UreD [Micromonospora sp. M61]MBQ1039250.1 urease accessory protein UreD [Micromonospora sp. C81]